MLDRQTDNQTDWRTGRRVLKKVYEKRFLFCCLFLRFFVFVSRVYFSRIFNAAARPKTAQKKGVPKNNTKAGAFKAQGVAPLPLSLSLSILIPSIPFADSLNFCGICYFFFCWLCLLCLLCLGALFNFQSDIWNLKFMLELAVVVAVYVVAYVVVVAAVCCCHFCH